MAPRQNEAKCFAVSTARTAIGKVPRECITVARKYVTVYVDYARGRSSLEDTVWNSHVTNCVENLFLINVTL